jgi:hypothetical protein
LNLLVYFGLFNASPCFLWDPAHNGFAPDKLATMPMQSHELLVVVMVMLWTAARMLFFFDER